MRFTIAPKRKSFPSVYHYVRPLLPLILLFILGGCASGNLSQFEFLLTPPAVFTPTPDPQSLCPVTEAAWLVAPDDEAVSNEPAPGYYYVNQDRSIWASAWWVDNPEYHLETSERSTKVGWFRPAGAPLEVSGRRIDGEAPPLQADIPCCYPTRFQASGLIFPSAGCWEVHARAADSELTFTVWVHPQE